MIRLLGWLLYRPPVKRGRHLRVVKPSELLALPKPTRDGDAELLAALGRALDAADKVHRLSTRLSAPVPVKLVDERPYGRYSFRYRLPVVVEVSRQSLRPGLSLLHELGHLIDHQLLGNGRYASIGRLPELADWREQAWGHDFLVHADSDAEHVEYLGQSHERFGRGYAQFIATRANDSELLALLDEAREQAFGGFWPEEGFAAIAVAFERLFLARGWLGQPPSALSSRA